MKMAELRPHVWMEKKARELVETAMDAVVVHEEEEDEILEDIIVTCEDYLAYHIKKTGNKCDIDFIIAMAAHILYQAACLKALRAAK